MGIRNNAESASIAVKMIKEMIILRDSREGGIFEMEYSELCIVRLAKKLTFRSRKVAWARKPKLHILEDVVRYELKVSLRWGESFNRERKNGTAVMITGRRKGEYEHQLDREGGVPFHGSSSAQPSTKNVYFVCASSIKGCGWMSSSVSMTGASFGRAWYRGSEVKVIAEANLNPSPKRAVTD